MRNTRVGNRQLSETQVLRLGRTLRRFSRTSREMMKLLGLEDAEVKIPRKKRRAKPQPPVTGAETMAPAE